MNPNKIVIPDGNDPNNPVRIYSDGIFDCFHFGHAKVIEQCKKAFKYTYVIVGVCSDADTIAHKGKNVMTEYERAECVRHCKWADEIICPCPWVLSMEFLDERNIHYVAHDNIPYPFKGLPDLYGPFKQAGRFFETQRTVGISTTDLIVRILKDKDQYFERSITKGSTAEELHLGKSEFLFYKWKVFWHKLLKHKCIEIVDICLELKKSKKKKDN